MKRQRLTPESVGRISVDLAEQTEVHLESEQRGLIGATALGAAKIFKLCDEQPGGVHPEYVCTMVTFIVQHAYREAEPVM
jgi:hypothetical protein